MAVFNVTKASGEQEPYNEDKLHRSLAVAGAGQQVIERIPDAVGDKLFEGIST